MIKGINVIGWGSPSRYNINNKTFIINELKRVCSCQKLIMTKA